MFKQDLYLKDNISKTKKQDSNLKLFDPTPNKIIKSNIDAFCNSLTLSEQKIFNFFLNHFNKYRDLYFTQITVSKILNISRGHVNRLIKKLCHYGFLFKWTRYKTSCLYRISSYFLKPDIRANLSWCFSALRKLPIWWLMSNNCQVANPVLDRDFKPIVTLVNRLNLFNVVVVVNKDYMGIEKKEKDKKIVEENISNRKVSSLEEQNQFLLTLSETKELIKSRFNLTRFGVIELYQFDDEALMHTLPQINFKGKRDKEYLFGVFCSLAYKWHKEKQRPKNEEQHRALILAYPIPQDGLKTNKGSVYSTSSKQIKTNNNSSSFEKKIETKKIWPEPLPGLPEETKERIRQRQQGTYLPIVETREEAAEKIDKWLLPPDGIAAQRSLGSISNPFRDKVQEPLKKGGDMGNVMQNLKRIINAQITIEDQPGEKKVDSDNQSYYNPLNFF